MALLEGTKAAVVTASGMAAISSTLFALLRSGDHLIIQACCPCTCPSPVALALLLESRRTLFYVSRSTWNRLEDNTSRA